MVRKSNHKMALKKAALHYHEIGRRGKIEVIATKPCLTQQDLSLAYTPGVAEPCLEIQANPNLARQYTAKGNLVGVVTNGTAVLGLGDIGALAGKPVMEGKGVLFKRFADIDVFDIELATTDPDELIRTVQILAPTFGGINLEDIKAPECFYIEEKLKETLDIPVFHDDQHGTAIISGAALLNALELVGKKIEDIRVVVSGAGAAGIACANFYVTLGVKPENILMTDSKGVLWKGRSDEGRNVYKDAYFRQTNCRTLEDAMVQADVFCGVSIAGIVSKKMVRSMADRPIIFAMANPDPEISYPDALDARPDVIMATGRSDYPNQVNNVLGFPFIFRGALDVEATAINEEMKLAAAKALAGLAKEEVPETVKKAYETTDLRFGPEYIIPKPFDSRVLVWATVAVAEAAMRTGVAKKQIDLDVYREQLLQKIDWSREIMRKIYHRARQNPIRIVFPEGDHPKIISAAAEIVSEGIGKPILLGKNKNQMLSTFKELNLDHRGIELIEPKNWKNKNQYLQQYYALRQRKGISQGRAQLDLKNYFYFGTMMVQQGDADAMVAGISSSYPEVLRPALQIIKARQGGRLVAGMYMIEHKNKLFFFADCAVNVNPTADDLVEIALMTAEAVRNFQIEPRIAMLSFTNFGAVRVPQTNKISSAVSHLMAIAPDLIVDGPLQADAALDEIFLKEHYPFSKLKKQPNVLIFPNLESGNISLKLVGEFGKVHAIGPILIGLDRPIHLLLRGNDIRDIVNLSAIANVDAQEKQAD